MRLRQRLLWPALGITLLTGSPTFCQSSTPLGTVLIPIQSTRPTLPSAADWGQEVLRAANAVWVEANAQERASKLGAWVEATPAQLAYVTRILQQNNEQQTAKTLLTLKDLFGVIRRVQWQAMDAAGVQRIVASWSVVAPQLVKSINAKELSATQRRMLEQTIVDLVTISKDARIGTPLARQTWQSQVYALTQLLKQSKTSIKMTALNVLEAIGPDAVLAGPDVQQCLRDSDLFVRCQAIRTLQACGMDQNARQMIAGMKNDADTMIRQTVEVALATPVVTETLMPAKQAAEVKQPAVAVSQPATLPAPVHVQQPLAPLKLDIDPTPSVMVKKQPEAAPMPMVKPLEPEKLPDAFKDIPTVPAVLPGKEPVEPVKKPTSSNTAVPLFGPAPLASTIQPVAATGMAPRNIPEVPPKSEVLIRPVTLWLPRLRQGSLDQQLQAARELGKLGVEAADAVPLLAECLLTGDVALRREIPLTLQLIGKPARLACPVLERALKDEDTDVKVNAARALLELADK